MPGTDSRGSTALLYVVAVALIGGFMYWLYLRSQQVETAVQPQTRGDSAQVETLSLDDLRQDAEGATGRRAVLDSVPVATGLGRGVFALQLDSARAYPVLMNPELIQRGEQLYGGDLVTLAGRVYVYTDSIGQEWVDRGAVSESAAENIPSSPSFLLADSLVLH